MVEAVSQLEKELPFEVPCIVNGKEVSTGVPDLFVQVDLR